MKQNAKIPGNIFLKSKEKTQPKVFEKKPEGSSINDVTSPHSGYFTHTSIGSVTKVWTPLLPDVIYECP